MSKDSKDFQCFVTKILVFLFSVLSVCSCFDLDRIDEIDFSKVDAEYAVPVFSSELKISNVTESTNSQATASIDDEGRITLFYSGELLVQTAVDLVPPIPVPDDLNIPDTNVIINVDFPQEFVSTQAIFKNNYATISVFFAI